MYRAAGNETLHPIDPPLPSADVGAPMPFAAVSEGSVLLFYFGGLDVLAEHSLSDELCHGLGAGRGC
jgi:hypothetical protein